MITESAIRKLLKRITKSKNLDKYGDLFMEEVARRFGPLGVPAMENSARMTLEILDSVTERMRKEK